MEPTINDQCRTMLRRASEGPVAVSDVPDVERFILVDDHELLKEHAGAYVLTHQGRWVVQSLDTFTVWEPVNLTLEQAAMVTAEVTRFREHLARQPLPPGPQRGVVLLCVNRLDGYPYVCGQFRKEPVGTLVDTSSHSLMKDFERAQIVAEVVV